MIEIQQHDFYIQYRIGYLNTLTNALLQSFGHQETCDDLNSTKCYVVDTEPAKKNSGIPNCSIMFLTMK